MEVQKPYFVYMLECADGTLYIGIAEDVARRVREHNGEGRVGAKYTRARRPVVLRYTEQCENRSAAQKLEYTLKQLSRTKKLELISRSPWGVY